MHRRADIYLAVPLLRAAGICNISFDLIAGLPHQSPDSWRNSLEELIQIAPQHVSIYLLEVDEAVASAASSSAEAQSIPPRPFLRTTSWPILRFSPPCAYRGGLRALRNFKLCKTGLRVRAQSQILASRTVSRIWRWRALFFFPATMG